MPAVEGLQQERRALSPVRDLALPFSRSRRRAQRTVAYVTIVYVPPQLLSLWASSAVSNVEELGSDVRTTTTHAWPWFEVGRARQGAGRVANGRTYP